MVRNFVIVFSILILFTLTACGGKPTAPAAEQQGFSAGQVTGLIDKANSCKPEDFDCQHISKLKAGLKKLTSWTATDFNSFMQAATSPGAQGAIIDTYYEHLTPEMLSSITPLLANSDWGLRRSAQKAAAKIGTEEAFDALVKVLKESDDATRELIPALLAEKPESEKVKSALSEIKKLGESSENAALRANAVKAVAKIGGHGEVNYLIKIALSKASSAIREEAVRGLEPWADETPVYNCLVDVSKGSDEGLAILAKKIAIQANKKK